MDGVTPVTVVFGPEGLTVVSIKGSTTYKRLISWKEIYALGLRGEKMTRTAFVKQISGKFKEVIDSNVKNMDSNKELLKRMRRTTTLPPPRPMAAP